MTKLKLDDWQPRNWGEVVHIIVTIILVVALVFLLAGCSEQERIPILITAETMIKDYLTGNDALLVEYFVGGMATQAIFTVDEMYQYDRLIRHLEMTGEVEYAFNQGKEWWE